MPLLPPEHEVHLADVGTSFRGRAIDRDPVTNAVVVVNVTTATIFWRFERPDATRFDRSAAIVVGADGTFEYVTIAGDLDAVGSWKRQAHITIPGEGNWWTSLIAFDVSDSIPVPV